MFRPSKKHWMVLLQWLLALSILTILYVWLKPSPDQLVAIGQFSLAWIMLSLLWAFIASVLTAYRWKILAQWMGNPPLALHSYLQAFLITRFVGQFSSALMMDLFGRGFALQLSERASRYKTATLSIFLERIFDVVIPLLLIGLWWLHQSAPSLSMEVLVLAFLLVWLLFSILAFPIGIRPASFLLAKVNQLCHKTPPLKSEPKSEPEFSTNRSFKSFTNELGIKQSLFIGWLSLLRMTCVVGHYWAIAASIDIKWDVLIATTSCAVAQLSGVISLTPGGLGIQEAGWSGVLRWMGQPAHQVLQFVIFQRIAILAIIGVLAASAYLIPKILPANSKTTESN